jgi:aquaporin Z
MKKYFAEMFGTMVLVLMGCGAAVMAGTPQPFAEVGTLGVAFAFGLSVVAMAYAIGGVSGCHINPAITLGVWMSGRMSGRDACMYMLFQVVGGIIGSAILYVLTRGMDSYTTLTGANTYVNTSRAFVAEMVFTCIFVFTALGATSRSANTKFAGLAIGLALVLVHIVCIPITGTSVNPARSIGPALFDNGVALYQLWLFIVAPLVGAVLASGLWRMIGERHNGTRAAAK